VPRDYVFNNASVTRSAPSTLGVEEAEAAKRRSYNHNPLTGTRQPVVHRDYDRFRVHQGELSRIGRGAANTSAGKVSIVGSYQAIARCCPPASAWRAFGEYSAFRLDLRSRPVHGHVDENAARNVGFEAKGETRAVRADRFGEHKTAPLCESLLHHHD